MKGLMSLYIINKTTKKLVNKMRGDEQGEWIMSQKRKKEIVK